MIISEELLAPLNLSSYISGVNTDNYKGNDAIDTQHTMLTPEEDYVGLKRLLPICKFGYFTGTYIQF